MRTEGYKLLQCIEGHTAAIWQQDLRVDPGALAALKVGQGSSPSSHLHQRMTHPRDLSDHWP